MPYDIPTRLSERPLFCLCWQFVGNQGLALFCFILLHTEFCHIIVWWVGTETKWHPFRRNYTQMHFIKWKHLNVNQNSISVCSKRSNWQHWFWWRLGTEQASISTNDVLFYWRTYASPGLNQLSSVLLYPAVHDYLGQSDIVSVFMKLTPMAIKRETPNTAPHTRKRRCRFLRNFHHRLHMKLSYLTTCGVVCDGNFVVTRISSKWWHIDFWVQHAHKGWMWCLRNEVQIKTKWSIFELPCHTGPRYVEGQSYFKTDIIEIQKRTPCLVLSIQTRLVGFIVSQGFTKIFRFLFHCAVCIYMLIRNVICREQMPPLFSGMCYTFIITFATHGTQNHPIALTFRVGRGCVLWSQRLNVTLSCHFPRYWPFVRGPTGHWWIPLTGASDVQLWRFLWSAPRETVKQTMEAPVIWDAIAQIRASL